MQLPEFKDRLNRLLLWPKITCRAKHKNMPVEEPPLRAELLNVDQLERHARSIAGAHRLATIPVEDRLLPRLAENEVRALINRAPSWWQARPKSSFRSEVLERACLETDRGYS